MIADRMQRERQHADRRLRLREGEKYRRQHDDRGRQARDCASAPRNRPMKMNSTMAAPALFLCGNTPRQLAGMLGLKKVRRVVDRKLRQEEDAEIARDQHDQRRRGHQVAEMPQVLRHQKSHRGNAHDDEREGEAAGRERRLPGRDDADSTHQATHRDQNRPQQQQQPLAARGNRSSREGEGTYAEKPIWLARSPPSTTACGGSARSGNGWNEIHAARNAAMNRTLRTSVSRSTRRRGAAMPVTARSDFAVWLMAVAYAASAPVSTAPRTLRGVEPGAAR